MDANIEKDAMLIDHLGGPAKVAQLLEYDPETGTQRVHNWKTRGIPARVRLEHQDIFAKKPARKPKNEP